MSKNKRKQLALELEDLRDQMWELAEQALDLIRRDAPEEHNRARSYWYAHLLGALDKEQSGFLGGSFIDMTETIRTIREEEEEEEESRFVWKEGDVEIEE